MKNTIYILALAAITAVTACKKETKKDQEHEATVPVITLLAPVENEAFHYGDTVKITGTITSEDAMHGYEVRVFDPATSVTHFTQSYHSHGTVFHVSEWWKNDVTDTTLLKIILEAAVDHDGNMVTEERSILCYPQ